MVSVLFFLVSILSFLSQNHGTALDDYVKKPDPTYKYEVFGTERGPTYTLYKVNMTSQTWKADLQSQPIWWHYLYITIPDQIDTKNTGFLFIDGGSNKDSPPEQTDRFVMLTTIVASTTNTVGACLKQIPNQPIVFKLEHLTMDSWYFSHQHNHNILSESPAAHPTFHMHKGCMLTIAAIVYDVSNVCVAKDVVHKSPKADPTKQNRTEDAVIAWTWKTFVDQAGADPEILLRMPMTKAGVRALDTISDLSQQKAGQLVNKFLVAGASKRGWTTWTLGAVDDRVTALAPIVMDLMHLPTNLHHYYRSLGGWTFAFDDYYALNFTANIDNPYIQAMADIIDPISYNARYANKPKYITSTGGDEFFMVDDSKYYYNELQGETYLRMVPNAEHSLAGHETSLLLAIRSFYLSVMQNKSLPKMSWTLNTTSTGGSINLKTDMPPETVYCYYATTLDGKRKDFRLLRATPGNPSKPQPHPVLWRKKYVEPLGETSFQVSMDNPTVGWTAFFIQVTFPGLDESVLEFTTQTMIIPDTYPFQDCHGEQCLGTLV